MAKKLLYLGLDPTNYKTKKALIHCPLIQIAPYLLQPKEKQEMQEKLHSATSVIFTSKNGVEIFFQTFGHMPLDQKTLICIGSITQKKLQQYGNYVSYIPDVATQEGIIALLETQRQPQGPLFLPQSAQARTVLCQYLKNKGISYTVCPLYEPKYLAPKKNIPWEDIDELVFTSPSVVFAFLHFFKRFPKDKTFTAIGPITKQALKNSLFFSL